MAEAGLPAPEYRTEGFLTTILYKNRPTSSQNVGENVIEKTGETLRGKAKREQDILNLLCSNPSISFAELALTPNVA